MGSMVCGILPHAATQFIERALIRKDNQEVVWFPSDEVKPHLEKFLVSNVPLPVEADVKHELRIDPGGGLPPEGMKGFLDSRESVLKLQAVLGTAVSGRWPPASMLSPRYWLLRTRKLEVVKIACHAVPVLSVAYKLSRVRGGSSQHEPSAKVLNYRGKIFLSDATACIEHRPSCS